MRKRNATLFLLGLLTLALATTAIASTGNATSKLKIVIDLSHGQGPADGNWTGNKLEALHADFEGNLSVVKGYEVVWATNLTESVLADAQFLFLGSVYGKNLSDVEVQVIVNWFQQGEKTIWVGTDSDYGGARYIVDNTNRVLRAIGSKIRAEPTSVEDPFSNCAGAYRVRANVSNTEDAEVAGIVAGANASNGVLFHGPTILYGFVDGVAVSLETTTVENVHWVMKTGPSGIVVDHDITIMPPVAHADGQEGSFVIMAVEKYAGPNEDCKIIVTGENPYGGYQPGFSSEYYGYPLDGPTLVMNAVDWGVMVESASDKTMNEISQLESTIATQASEISTLETTITGLESDLAGLQTLLYAAIGLAIIGILIGAVGVFKK
ncbi:MAG: hypothetical protein NWF13_04600 [Candidatus Bathyarchaeota archaeon]|nr:hypothetical protein [Candidatus Bathyarchaeota archaeon]